MEPVAVFCAQRWAAGRCDLEIGSDKMKQPAVYIMASQCNGTLYIGITSDLIKRIAQHKLGHFSGFTKKNNVKLLVWYEMHETIECAIAREKSLKTWQRSWKIELVEKKNPYWQDLWQQIVGNLTLVSLESP